MSRNGLGVYSRVPGSAYTAGTTADGAELDAEMNDIATALTGSLAADGQTPFAGNFNGAGYAISNITVNGINVSASGAFSVGSAGTAAEPALRLLDAGLGLYRSAANELSIAAGSTPVLSIDQTRMVLHNGQLKFPATQNPSADPNTLDDYEEGSWTPAGNGITFVSAVGRYVKIGRLVHVFFSVQWPTTSNTDPARIGGLPFACNSEVPGTAAIAAAAGLTTLIDGYVPPTATYIRLFSSSYEYVNADPTGIDITGYATYLTAA